MLLSLALLCSAAVDSALMVPSGVRSCAKLAPELVCVQAVDGRVPLVVACWAHRIWGDVDKAVHLMPSVS